MLDFLAYPSVGSFVILPLYQANGFEFVKVLVWGGEQAGALFAMTW